MSANQIPYYPLQKYHLNTAFIDSFRIRVPLEKVKILDKRLITDYICYYPTLDALDDDTGEILDVFGNVGEDFRHNESSRKKAQPFTKIIHGITYRFFPKAFISGKQKYAKEYLVIQISAKMSKKRYFDGVSMETIHYILDDINSFGVIKLDIDTLWDGLVSDIDICLNQFIDLKSLKIAFSLIDNFTMSGKKPLLRKFNPSLSPNSKNIGIEFNKREKATNTTPYCKIYHKGFELETKSLAFYTQYLEPMRKTHLDQLVRFEFTIKNAKHKQYLQEQGLMQSDCKTLFDLLRISSTQLKRIAQSGLNHYLQPRETKTAQNTDLPPIDLLISELMEKLIIRGESLQYFENLHYMIENRAQRSRLKAKVKTLLENLTSVDNNLKQKLKNNDKAQDFLKQIGF